MTTFGNTFANRKGPFEHPEWDQANIWISIRNDDDWELAYLPYDNEPVRHSASSLVSESSIDGPLGVLALASIAKGG